MALGSEVKLMNEQLFSFRLLTSSILEHNETDRRSQQSAYVRIRDCCLEPCTHSPYSEKSRRSRSSEKASKSVMPPTSGAAKMRQRGQSALLEAVKL